MVTGVVVEETSRPILVWWFSNFSRTPVLQRDHGKLGGRWERLETEKSFFLRRLLQHLCTEAQQLLFLSLGTDVSCLLKKDT